MNIHRFISDRGNEKLRPNLPSNILEWIDMALAIIFLALVIVIPGSLVVMGLVSLWKRVFG